MKMMNVALLITLALTGSSFAETLKLDTKASEIQWTGTKATGSSHNGVISFKEGSFETKGTEVKGGHFSVDMNSLTDKDLEGSPDYKAKLEGHLKSEDFFNVAKFPESTFKITSITHKAGDDYMVKGDLTMIGVTKPVEFPAKLTVTKDTLNGSASVKLNRTNWGLKYGSKSFFKELVGDKIIKDEFDLVLKVVAKK